MKRSTTTGMRTGIVAWSAFSETTKKTRRADKERIQRKGISQIECHRCRRFGHVQRNCPSRSSRPRQQLRQQEPRSVRRQTWCSLHQTHLHSDAKCCAQTRSSAQERSRHRRPNRQMNQSTYTRLDATRDAEAPKAKIAGPFC